MNAIFIILALFISLVILIPLLEKYQHRLGLDKMNKYAKYILPLVGISLVIKLVYVLMNQP
ncbi:hypothetical protein AAEU32_02600 [Pseudoalteromonas sp. SSDWG2]|uniref:hypothetical protein n=1 Tax=Pseudoalteromonas sp. SSDWG2 TaxID=3139391 RepID=UPI003BACA37C